MPGTALTIVFAIATSGCQFMGGSKSDELSQDASPDAEADAKVGLDAALPLRACATIYDDLVIGDRQFEVVAASTFAEAASECARNEGRLAVANNLATNNQLSDLLNQLGTRSNDCPPGLQCAWIGLSQLAGAATPEQDWQWSDAQDLGPFSAWAGAPTGEPNDGNNDEDGAENCAVLESVGFGSPGQWNDTTCEGSTVPALCECPPP